MVSRTFPRGAFPSAQGIIKVARSNLQEFVQHTVGLVVDVPVPQILIVQVGKETPKELLSEWIVEQIGELLHLEVVEEIVKVVQTSQERCHHIMEEIIEAVWSNLQDVPVQETPF